MRLSRPGLPFRRLPATSITEATKTQTAAGCIPALVLLRSLLCAVNVCTFQRVRTPPGNSRLPRSNRSGGGGNEPAEAFGVKGHSYGDSATMQAVTQVNARRSLEKSNVDADTVVGWGRLARQGKLAMNAPCRSTGVESSSMYRRNVQKARDTDGDGGRHATNGQPARA